MDMDLAETLSAPAVACTPARHEISLSQVKLSPHADEVEHATIAWMHAFGLLPDQRYRDKVTRMAVWGYAGFSHPFGSFEELVLYSKYITLWLLWDDVIVEKATDLSAILHGLAAAFLDDDQPDCESDSYLRAWRSIIDGYRALGVSREFLQRLNRKMAVWVKTVAHENRSVHVVDQVSAWSHLRKRLVTIGVIPTAQLLDLDVRDLDRIPLARRVVMTAAAVVAIVNELVSVEKDRDRVNLVALVQREHQCDFETAYSHVVALYRSSLRKLSALIDALPSELKGWGVFISHMAEGFSYWHFICPRYERNRLICHVAGMEHQGSALSC